MKRAAARQTMRSRSGRRRTSPCLLMEITFYGFDPVFRPDIKTLADITPPNEWEDRSYRFGIFGSGTSGTSSFDRTSTDTEEYSAVALDKLKI